MLAGIWMAADYGYIAAILAVLAAMTLWALRHAGDGSRGAPVVSTPGQLRLALEIVLFGIAAYGYWVEWSRAASETFPTVSVLHYAITWSDSGG